MPNEGKLRIIVFGEHPDDPEYWIMGGVFVVREIMPNALLVGVTFGVVNRA